MTDWSIEYHSKGDFAPVLARPGWHELWDKQFPDGPYGCYVLSKGAVPISIVRLFRRSLTIRNLVSLSALGIGGVFTVDEFRGQGYASRLLSHAIKENEKTNQLLAILYSARPSSIYTNLGFIRLSEFHGGLYVRTIPPYRAFVFPDERWEVLRKEHF